MNFLCVKILYMLNAENQHIPDRFEIFLHNDQNTLFSNFFVFLKYLDVLRILGIAAKN